MNKRLQFIIKPFILFILCAVFVFLMYKNYRCPIYSAFQLPCPGCGITRAAVSLLKLDFKQAFYYNPSIYPIALSAVLLTVMYFFKKLNHKIVNFVVWINFTILISVWLIRLVI